MQDTHVHFDWDSTENRRRRARVIPTLCGYAGVYRVVTCVLDFVLMRRLLGMGPWEWLRVRRADAALELYSSWIAARRVRFNGLGRNAMRRESGYIERISVSPAPCDFCSKTLL